MSNRPFIPFHRPSIGEEEIRAVNGVLRSGWLTAGPRTMQFEQEFQQYVGSPYALAVNSCTAGLHLALAALRLAPGDEVITTPLTFCATVNAILHVGAKPVLADVGDDGNIDPESVAQRLTSRTRAIIPVHLGGLPCRMQEIWRLARERGLFVIEDAAHAAGARYRGWPVGAGNPAAGARSDAVAFSFYATKNLTTGEGGMVTTHNKMLAREMRTLCLHGIGHDAWNRYANRARWFYEVLACGFKYNFSDILAAIGIAQLRKLNHFILIRTRYAHLYHRAFRDVPELEIPPDDAQSRHAWHLYMLRLNLDRLRIGRDEFIEALASRGIGASVHFIPIPLHPYYAGFGFQPCPRALQLYPRLVSLPLYPAMTEEQLDRVADAVKSVVRSARLARATAVVSA